MNTARGWVPWIAAGAFAACAGTAAGASGTGVPAGASKAPAERPAAQQPALVPAGYGTLRQDAITVQLRSDALLIKVTPLDENVIRLTAPDTYQRLHALAESRREQAAQTSMIEHPTLFMVSLFSYQPDVTYQPEDLQLRQQGQVLRPAAIIPVTPGWGQQRLGQQESQLAIYAFDSDIDFTQPLTVRYGMVQSDAWSGIIQALDVERAKVLARAKSDLKKS